MRIRALIAAVVAACSFSLLAPPPAAQADDPPLVEAEGAINLTRSFWARNLPHYWGRQFVQPALPNFGYGPNGIYDSRVQARACGSRVFTVNAFYCRYPNGYQFFGFDASFLHDNTVRWGDAFLYVLIAHEYGHAVQTQLGRPINELQADCLSGAALRGMVYDGTFRWDAGDWQEIDNTMKAIGASKDTNYADPAQYGSWRQRYSYFVYGYNNFARACF